MKKWKKLSVIAMATIALLGLAACGDKESKAKKDDAIQTKIEKKTTITFWHAMNGPQEEALKKLTTDFEKANPNIEVKLQNQSQYSDLQAKINSTLQSPKDLPTITQAYPGWLYSAAKDDLLVNLKPYIDNKEIGWKDQEQITPSLMKGAQIDGKQYGIPFNKSTEVLYYNADMLKEYGVEVPKTMDELKQAAKTIYEKSNGEVVGAGFDVLNNYYVTGMKNAGQNFTDKINFDGKASKAVIKYYADGVKDGYFRTAGSDRYLSGPFANKKVAMFIGSISGEAIVKKTIDGKFNYGIAKYPTKYTMQQGTDIYMFKNASKAQRTAAFLYMKFLAEPSNQAYWAKSTGYMPIVDSVKNSSEYKDSTDLKTPAQLESATQNLFSLPTTATSNKAYTEVGTIMENILANPNKNLDKMIKDATPQFQDAWNN